MSLWRRRRNEPPVPPADLAPEDSSFYPTVADPFDSGPGRQCDTCKSLPDTAACPVCWSVAYLVHPAVYRRQIGTHWYACQACRQDETVAALREQGLVES